MIRAAGTPEGQRGGFCLLRHWKWRGREGSQKHGWCWRNVWCVQNWTWACGPRQAICWRSRILSSAFRVFFTAWIIAWRDSGMECGLLEGNCFLFKISDLRIVLRISKSTYQRGSSEGEV